MSIPKINQEWINQVAAPSFYATYYLNMHKAAREVGYNLVLHGSVHRDLDVIAIPWTPYAVPHEELITRLCKVTGTFCDMAATEKPHGRVAYVLLWWRRSECTGGDHGQTPYIDLSIMHIHKSEDEKSLQNT